MTLSKTLGGVPPLTASGQCFFGGGGGSAFVGADLFGTPLGGLPLGFFEGGGGVGMGRELLCRLPFGVSMLPRGRLGLGHPRYSYH